MGRPEKTSAGEVLCEEPSNAREAIILSDWANGRIPGPRPKFPRKIQAPDPEPLKTVITKQELEDAPVSKRELEATLKKSSDRSKAYWGTVILIAALGFWGHPWLAVVVLIAGYVGGELRR